MSKSLNRVALLGNLGADPEWKQSSGGKSIATISIATTHSSKDDNGAWTDVTDWHRVVFFDKYADIARDYLRKGSRVYIEGRLQTRKWQDQQGQDRYITEVIGQDMNFCGGKNQNQGEQSGQANEYAAPPTQKYTTPPTPPPIVPPQYPAPGVPYPPQYPAPGNTATGIPPQYPAHGTVPVPPSPNQNPPQGFDDDIPF